jgi:type IV secretory pathway protease TraF
MGDNRPVSEDSRYFGSVPKDYIVGKAILVYRR